MWKQKSGNEKHPASLRTARRGTLAKTPGSEPGHESDLTQTARIRRQADKHRPGMSNTSRQSTVEGPSAGQWPGNRGARQASRKIKTTQQQQASTPTRVF